MKKSVSIRVAIAALVILCSCSSKSTEKYAQEEHGKEFGAWVMNYEQDGDSNIYIPHLKLRTKAEGTLQEIQTRHSFFDDRILGRDTTVLPAFLNMFVLHEKSKNDASFYNSIVFYLSDTEEFETRAALMKFSINESSTDSLSVFITANSNGYFIPEKDASEKITALFANNKKVTVKAVYRNALLARTYDGSYLFELEPSEKMEQALDVLHDRAVLADKEKSQTKTNR